MTTNKYCHQHAVTQRGGNGNGNINEQSDRKDFWAFIDTVGFHKKDTKPRKARKLLSQDTYNKYRKIYDELRGDIDVLSRKTLDYGGGDDFVDMDLPDSIIARGETFYNTMKTAEDIARFGNTGNKPSGPSEIGMYAFFAAD
jgi:hypothetical protein